MTGDSGAANDDLTVRFAVLARIAAGLCRDAGIARVEMAKGDTWSWSPATRILKVGRSSFATLGIEGCAGVIAHEVGHSLISRYHLLGAKLGRGGVHAAKWLNAVEDPRVEAYMSRRYPGVRRWIDEANRLLLAEWDSDDLPLLRHHQFGVGACIDENTNGRALTGALLPEVLQELQNTLDARRQYRDGYLPDDDGTDPDDLAGQHRQLCAKYVFEAAVSPREEVVQTLALYAWAHFQREIAPAIERLFDADVAEVAALIMASPDLRAELKHATTRMPPLHDRLRLARHIGERRGPLPPCDDEAIVLARLWLNQLGPERTRRASLGVGGKPLLSAGIEVPTDERHVGSTAGVEAPPLGNPVPRPAQPAAPIRPLPTRAGLIDRLERVLRDELRAHRRQIGRVYAHTGVRADLRRVMTNQGPLRGDPGRWQPAWHRPVPVRPDAAFCLLIDCSGSMRGPKITAAVEAALVFLEAIGRVGASVMVAGFQDEIIPLVYPDESLTAARSAIESARLEPFGRRPGGHNQPRYNDDGPCILEAAKALQSIPAAQRVLVVLTDGLPHGRRSGAGDLSDAVRRVAREGIDVIGVGIGRGATHVRDFYPRAVIAERVEGLAAAMVGVLGAGR